MFKCKFGDKIQNFIEQKINMLEYKELSVAVKKYQRLTTLN